MRRAFFLLAITTLLFLQNPSICPAQTATDPNAGSRLEWDASQSIWRFKWWGKSGFTYFIQHSEDLRTWTWVPRVESGTDAVKEWSFSSTADKLFVRLRYTDEFVIDPESADFDHDGVSNLAEVQQGTDPFLADHPNLDSDGDGINDFQEYQRGSDPKDYFSQGRTPITPRIFIYSGGGARVEAGEYSTNPIVFKIVNAATETPLVNAPVTVDIGSGTGKVSLTRGGPPTSSMVILSDAQGLVRAYFKAP